MKKTLIKTAIEKKEETVKNKKIISYEPSVEFFYDKIIVESFKVSPKN